MHHLRDKIRMALRQDGKDHINLSIFAETVIGQHASPEFRKRFFIPHLGEFGSARCFANWMCSGGDDTLRFDQRRYDTRSVSLNVFRQYMLYGKFYQIVSVRGTYSDHKAGLDLPWVMYKKHLTGIREFDRWDAYPHTVKAMVRHAVENNTRVKFDWEHVAPQVLETVNKRIREIAELSGTDPDAVVDIIAADDVAKERKAARKEQLNADRSRRQDSAVAAAATSESPPDLSGETAPELPQEPVQAPHPCEPVLS